MSIQKNFLQISNNNFFIQFLYDFLTITYSVDVLHHKSGQDILCELFVAIAPLSIRLLVLSLKVLLTTWQAFSNKAKVELHSGTHSCGRRPLA